MPGVESSMVRYKSGSGQTSANLARPAGAGPFPAVIVIQEWWGLNDHIKDVANRYAGEGYVALAPDLFHGKVTADPNEAGKLMSALSEADALRDLNAGVDYLKGLPYVNRGRVGVTGFCMGGSYALLLPCRNLEIKAAAPYYGQVPPEKTLANLACPILYIYGDADSWITMDDVKRLEAALKKHKKAGEVKIYHGAPHAFFNDSRPDVYRQREARDAWSRTLAFFAKHLKG